MKILSGGADGSDKFFGELGIETIVFSFSGHNAHVPKIGQVVKIPQDQLNLREPEYLEACFNLGRHSTNNQFVKNLCLRNMYQIKNKQFTSNIVIAIAELEGESKVKGGTGYAIERAKKEHIPIIVLNKLDNIFYIFNGFVFTKLYYNITLDKNAIITGIGSREINEIHKEKIKEIFETNTIKSEVK